MPMACAPSVVGKHVRLTRNPPDLSAFFETIVAGTFTESLQEEKGSLTILSVVSTAV